MIVLDHTKHLNTPRLVADDTQKTVWKWEQQEPFGAGACNPDPDGDNVQFEFNLRFPGQYFDRETNLHYNYFRDYDPSAGRYVQSDLVGIAGGLNTYSYASGTPILRFDSLGLLDEGGKGDDGGSSGGKGNCNLIEDKTLYWIPLGFPPFLAARKSCIYECRDACSGHYFYIQRRPVVFNIPWRCQPTLTPRDL